MWPITESTNPINLIRYLIMWRVNSSLVVLPKDFPRILSKVLGLNIAERLPTREARDWQEALAAEDEDKDEIVETLWPIEAVLLPYPGKLNYGPGEIILWELKLMGDSADHGLFLELILPAMEEISTTKDPRWHRHNWAWGNFDIYAIYVAKGDRWEPIASEGKLDLSYRPGTAQWAEGLSLEPSKRTRFHKVIWDMPFDLGAMPDFRGNSYRSHNSNNIPKQEVPTLRGLFEALLSRMASLLPGKGHTPEEVWNLLDEEQQTKIRKGIRKARHVSRNQDIALQSSSKKITGRWIGTQSFARPIPRSLLPCLNLASILHVGKQTHFGCGTFRLE